MEKKYFYGNEIGEYGVENGFVDYETMAKCFDAVLCNNIVDRILEVEQVSGMIDNEDKIEELENLVETLTDELEIERIQQEIEELANEEIEDIFQYYIVSDNALPILEQANEIVWYDSELDIYIWGVTHFGTGWSHVLTSIPID